jgi:hypothetical protein
VIIAEASSRRTATTDGVCYALAGGLTVAWFLIFNHGRPDYLVDEAGHLGNIYHFLEGKPGWPEQMPMLPGYHFIVAGLWQLHLPFKLLTLARLVSTVCALVALAGFALAWRRFHAAPAGPATLLFALLPLMQPFTGLAYTDVPALAFVLLAWGAHLTGRRALAVLLLLAAAGLRQTSLVWAVFIVAWEILGVLPPGASGWRACAVRLWPRVRWPLLPLVLAGAAVLVTGRLTVGVAHGNPATFNPAQIHFGGLLLLLLGLPLWVRAVGAAPSWLLGHGRARPGRTAGLVMLALGAAVVLGATYVNPHAWNRDLYWEGCSFTLLRNWPLVGLERYPVLRFVSGLNVVALALSLVVALRRQPQGGAIALALLAGAAPVAISGLVEPRYFIPPLVFALFLVRLDRAATVALGVWWALLVAGHAPFIVTGRALW